MRKQRAISPGLSRDSENQAGFSLIEVLVAIIVLSIGLIGIAGLLVSVINRNQSSVYHSVAASLATDIAERMRANKTMVSFTPASNKYSELLKLANPAAFATDCATSAATCNPDSMAQYDADRWEQLVAKVLPGGKGIVCIDGNDTANDGDLSSSGTPASLTNTGCNAAGNSIVIKIFWDESRSNGRASAAAGDVGAAKTTQRYVLVFQP